MPELRKKALSAIGVAFLASTLNADQAAFQVFNAASGNRWSAIWNANTGSPHRISGFYLEVKQPITERNVEAVATALVAQHRKLLDAEPGSLALSAVHYQPPVKGGGGSGTWNVYFHQHHHGVPVIGGSVRMIIRNQRLTSFGSDFFPGIDVSTKPEVTLEQAIEIATSDMGVEKLATTPTGRLVVFPDLHAQTLRYYLAWEIVMPVIHLPEDQVPGYVNPSTQSQQQPPNQGVPQKIPVQWRYMVDAISGRIVDRTNLMVYEMISGRVTAMARPFRPSDTPIPVDLAELSVSVRQGPTTIITQTNAAGQYSASGLAAGSATVSATLSGPRVAVHNNETADPDATHSAAVTAPGTHNWNWSADDPSAADVEENAFYHVTRIRNWFLRGAPFDVEPTPVPMQVYVRDGAYCNAGAAGDGLYFGSGDGTCEDFALCSDILYHEYTHRIVAKVYNTAGVVLPYNGLTGAMNEAWSDYFSASHNGNPAHGTGCYRGRNIDTPDRRYPDDLFGEVHVDGIIFAGAIWDVRTALGAAYVDGLALRAMKQATLDYSEYLRAMLEEDDDPAFSPSPAANADLSDGSPNIDVLCRSYYDRHGIFDPLCVGHTLSPIAVITSPPVSRYNLINASMPLTIEGTALGGATGFSRFTLEYARVARPLVWMAAGVTLTGGGTAPVTAGVLGTLNVAPLADGVYRIRLTVTDTAGASSTSTTTIAIDRSLRTGWPRAMEESFYGTPAVADVDRSYPGLEVVALARSGRVYVWHADGTAAPGWPAYAGGGLTAPAVGDLDGDGNLDIVVAARQVHAFRSNGTGITGFPQMCGAGDVVATPLLADLDRDGTLEIIIGSDANQLCAWHFDGSSVTGWPVATTGEVRASAAAADLDGDGATEVVAGTYDGNLYALRADGTPLPGWPRVAPGPIGASPAIGDLDGDGDLEIVAGLFNRRVAAWHHDGSYVARWPQTTYDEIDAPSSAALADVDGDGRLDVLVMTNSSYIVVLRADATAVAGWPPPILPYTYESLMSAPSVGDVDGDGRSDVVAEGIPSADASENAVMAFDRSGTMLPGWPKFTNQPNSSSPVITDLDRDGRVDIVIGARGVFIWSLASAHRLTPLDWPTIRHDQQRTGAVTSADQAQVAIDQAASPLIIGGPSQQKLAQTITSAVTGRLTEVQLPVVCTAGVDLILRIEGVAGGVPDGIARLEQTFAGATLPPMTPSTLRRFTLSTPVLLNTGEQYAIVLRSTGPTASSSCGIAQSPRGDFYAGGHAYFDARPNPRDVWRCQCSYAGRADDLPFRTIVRP